MNLSETKTLIYKYFLENDILILPDDFLKIVTISLNEELDIEIVKEGLKSFEETNLIKKVIFHTLQGKVKSEKIGYILSAPLQSYSQNLVISGETAFYIANTINSLRDKDDQERTNPLSISAQEIDSLLIVIGNLIKERQDKFEEDN